MMLALNQTQPVRIINASSSECFNDVGMVAAEEFNLLQLEHCVPHKIIAAIGYIAKGSAEQLRFDNPRIPRDWRWAPERVGAKWEGQQQPSLDDYIIAAGKACAMEGFVLASFSAAGQDWRTHAQIERDSQRSGDLKVSQADSLKAVVAASTNDHISYAI